MLDVMFYEVFKEERRALEQFLPSGIRTGFTDKTIQEYDPRRIKSPFISIRTQSLIPLEWAPRLSGIFSRSMGYDHLQAYLRSVDERIPCGYLPTYCANAVAEQAVMMMLALMRKLPEQLRAFENFGRDGLTGLECRRKNVLVIGVGNIGREIVRLAKGWDMNVRGVDPVRRLAHLKYVGLTDGIRWADVIFCALPLTKSTKGLLNRSLLKKCKKGVFLINIARGEITPAEGLKRLLSDGVLAGLGLDVYPDEERLADYLRSRRARLAKPLKELLALNGKHNVIFTPHNAFNSSEAVVSKARLTGRAVQQFLRRRSFPHQVVPK